MRHFEWDGHKAKLNLRKHGIAFEVAIHVFDDPLVFVEQDRHIDGEERWQAIGTVGAFTLVVVAHTVRDDDEGNEIIRVISARRAERHERRRYEEGKYR
jgi:uncharacterized DUF497 family protein